MPQTQIGFARDTKVKPSQGEIATTTDGRDITLGFVHGLLPPRDKLLWLKGFNYEVYEDLLRDDQVKSTYQQRRLALIASEWEVDPGGTSRKDKKAAEFIKEVVGHLDPHWDDVTDKVHHGVFYGFGVAECLWGTDGVQIYPEAIKVKRQSRFRFWEDGSLRLLTPNNLFEGEVLPERKFWVFNSGSQDHDDPYGTGLAHYLYWPVFFKRNGFRFWANYLETFAQPKKMGKYPPNASEAEKKTLLEAMHALNNDSGMILPEGMVVEFLEASRAGTADYQSFQDICNKAISKIVLSQTMTTDDGSSLSQSKTHYAVRQDVVKADADLICGSFNRSVVRWLTDWNFPGAAYPRIWRQIEEPEDLDSRVTREKTIFDMGFRPTLEHIEETYGGEWVDTQAQEAQKATPEQELQSLFPAGGDAAPGASAEATDAEAQPPDAPAEAAFSEFNFENKAMLLQQIHAAISAYKIGASLQEMQALKDSLKWELASLPLGDTPATDFSESQSVDFATSGEKKTKQCTKGYNCGGGCISKNKKCRKKLPGQFHTYAEWLENQTSSMTGNAAAGSGGEPDPMPAPARTSESATASTPQPQPDEPLSLENIDNLSKTLDELEQVDLDLPWEERRAKLLELEDKIFSKDYSAEEVAASEGRYPPGTVATVYRDLNGQDLSFIFKVGDNTVDVNFSYDSTGKETAVVFTVNGSLDMDRENIPKGQRDRMAVGIARIMASEAAKSKDGRIFECTAHKSDGKGEDRVKAYKKMGFSEPDRGGFYGEMRAKVVNGKLEPYYKPHYKDDFKDDGEE